MNTDTSVIDNRLGQIHELLIAASNELVRVQQVTNSQLGDSFLDASELLFANLVKLGSQASKAINHIHETFDYLQMCYAVVHPLPPLDVAEPDDDDDKPPDVMTTSEAIDKGLFAESNIPCRCSNCKRFVMGSWPDVGDDCGFCGEGKLERYTPDPQESLSLGEVVSCRQCGYATFATQAPELGACPNCGQGMLVVPWKPQDPNPYLYWQCYKCMHVVEIGSGYGRGGYCPVCEEGTFDDVIPF